MYTQIEISRYIEEQFERDPGVARIREGFKRAKAKFDARLSRRRDVIASNVYRKIRIMEREDFRKALKQKAAPILPADTRRWCDTKI